MVVLHGNVVHGCVAGFCNEFIFPLVFASCSQVCRTVACLHLAVECAVVVCSVSIDVILVSCSLVIMCH